VRRHPVAAYLVLAVAFSWTWWGWAVAQGWVTRAGQGWPTHLPGLLGPALAALVVTAVADGRAGLRDLGRRVVRWRIGWRWWAVVAATALLPLLAWAWQALTGGGGPDLEGLRSYSGAPLAPVVVTFGYVLLVNGFGEEVGWRGFLADRLLRRHGLATTALLVWVAWGLWHLPLFLVVENFRDLGWGALGWAVGLLAGSVVLTWLYAGSGRSILLVAVWHTVFNVATATEATSGTPAAVASTLVMVAAVIVAWRARRPGHRARQADLADPGSRAPRAWRSTGSS
jgi:membrane protease YdiL (CAAX protease family)